MEPGLQKAFVLWSAFPSSEPGIEIELNRRLAANISPCKAENTCLHEMRLEKKTFGVQVACFTKGCGEISEDQARSL